MNRSEGFGNIRCDVGPCALLAEGIAFLQQAVRKPIPLQSAKHRVVLRVRASMATWSRDEAFLKGWPIVTAGKSGGTPARLPRGLSQTHKALPSFVCSSRISLENVGC